MADAAGDPVVIDWRAEVSTAFYRASRTTPMGVRLRRRFGIDRGTLTAYEDEHLTDPGEATGASDILASEIERPREGPMRDIVATIQPEQDVIVRSDVATTICVQGAPGTGKTAVGLHRAAWLLYAFRERLARAGVLVIGPNRAFLDHIGAVLPALGEVEVSHATIEELLASVPVRGVDSVETAVLKGDSRLAEVLHRAVWSHVRVPTEALVLPRGAHKWRVPAYEVADIVEELRTRGVRYDAARQMLPHRLAHAVLLRMERAGDSPDDRVQDAVARSAVVRRYAATVWPALDPRTVLFELLGDPDALARAADGLLDDDEQRLAALDVGAQEPWRRTVVGGRRGAAGRDPRPPRAHAQPRARGARRGAGPLADAAAGGRPALLHRLGDGARRHRPGHHAVGDRLVGVLAAPPRARPTGTSRCSTAGSACRPR